MLDVWRSITRSVGIVYERINGAYFSSCFFPGALIEDSRFPFSLDLWFCSVQDSLIRGFKNIIQRDGGQQRPYFDLFVRVSTCCIVVRFLTLSLCAQPKARQKRVDTSTHYATAISPHCRMVRYQQFKMASAHRSWGKAVFWHFDCPCLLWERLFCLY